MKRSFLTALLSALVFGLIVLSLQASESVVLKDIKHTSSKGYTNVVFYLTGVAEFEEFRLKNPERIVISIKNASVGTDIKKAIPVEDGILTRIRTSQFDQNTVRIVLDIPMPSSYKVSRTGINLAVEIAGIKAEEPKRVEAEVEEPKKAEPKVEAKKEEPKIEETKKEEPKIEPSPTKAEPSLAEELDCLMCHKDLTEGKVVHQAVAMGCQTCHGGVDAKDIPHKLKGTKGLSSELPDLCWGCHDKSKFIAPTVHAPVGVGMCTNCHNPHRSVEAKLIAKGLPDLCHDCHDKAEFTKKTIHAPVAGGMCLSCHAPHVHANEALLLKKGNLLCRECHPNVEREIHAVAGFKEAGHPLRGRKDPLRPGKVFSCLSCHLPHSSDWMKLFRYEAQSTFDLCTKCHKM